MRHLINVSVYAFNKSYDYQSVCEPGAAPKQGAGHRSAYVVSKIHSWTDLKGLQAWTM
jgi:voltage-dependent calcium channel alpha-2/delta-1